MKKLKTSLTVLTLAFILCLTFMMTAQAGGPSGYYAQSDYTDSHHGYHHNTYYYHQGYGYQQTYPYKNTHYNHNHSVYQNGYRSGYYNGYQAGYQAGYYDGYYDGRYGYKR